MKTWVLPGCLTASLLVGWHALGPGLEVPERLGNCRAKGTQRVDLLGLQPVNPLSSLSTRHPLDYLPFHVPVSVLPLSFTHHVMLRSTRPGGWAFTGMSTHLSIWEGP